MADQTRKPRLALTARHLLRGESLVASAGLLAAALLVAALGASAWWAVFNYQRATVSAHERHIEAIAQLLSRNAEGLLAADRLPAVQRLVTDSAREHNFDRILITIPSLKDTVIASAGLGVTPPAPDLTLPARWSEALADAAAQPTPRRDASGVLSLSIPLLIPGRGSATLQLTDSAASPVGIAAAAETWQLKTGIGVIGAGAMATLLIGYRAMRKRLRALGAIGEALSAAGTSDAAEGELVVSADLGAEATAWNKLVSDRAKLRELVAANKTIERLSSRRGRDGDFGSVCDALWVGLILVDDQFKVRYVNGAASVLLRAKRDELANTDFRTLIDEPKVLEAIRGVASGAVRNRSVCEVRREGESGDTVLRISVRPLRKDETGSAVVAIEDVTQQRVADESRNSFVAQATHELRTPLTNMRLYIEMLTDDNGAAAEDPAKRSDALNVINQEVRRLERIVGDMLSVAEIEAGSLKLVRDDVRINTVIEELAADFREQAAQKDIRLKFDMPPKLPVLRGDRDKIVMAIHNLVANAVKYTPAGGEVTVRASEDKGSFTIEVIDNGIGIKDEERELIFEKFYRAKDRRISNITGTGLGLAIAREVVRLHGGDITVRSQLDKGSTFTLTLPAAA